MTMLRPAAEGPGVSACNSGRHGGEGREDGEGVRGGARLAGLLRDLAGSEPAYAPIAVEEMPCLFACKDFCTVPIRAPGKLGYVLGRFAPDAAAARAILDYPVHHPARAAGRVAYPHSPAGIKRAFLARV